VSNGSKENDQQEKITMSTPETKETIDRVSPGTKHNDLESIGKNEDELKEFLLSRKFAETSIEGYLNGLNTKEWKRPLALFRGDRPMSFTFDAAFNDFVVHCPGWSDPTTRTFLFDSYPAHTQMKVLRLQTTHICTAHADLVLVHLERCIRADADCEILMPDLSALLCRMYSTEGFQGKFIRDYVSGAHKISASNFLRSIYGVHTNQMDTIKLNIPTSPEMAARLMADNKHLRTILAEHPALLSFELGGDFKIPGIFSYDGTPSCELDRIQEKTIRQHAMVVVGMRSVDNKFFYLCMNFWKTKFFVELSDEYLARSNAEITTLHAGVPLEELLLFRDVPRFRGLSVETVMEADSDHEDEAEGEQDDEQDDEHY
jgi:hypothetical protein